MLQEMGVYLWIYVIQRAFSDPLAWCTLSDAVAHDIISQNVIYRNMLWSTLQASVTLFWVC